MMRVDMSPKKYILNKKQIKMISFFLVCTMILSSLPGCATRRILITSKPKGAEIQLGKHKARTPHHFELSAKQYSGILTYPDGTIQKIQIPEMSLASNLSRSTAKIGSNASYSIAYPLGIIGVVYFIIAYIKIQIISDSAENTVNGDKNYELNDMDTAGICSILGAWLFFSIGESLEKESVKRMGPLDFSHPCPQITPLLPEKKDLPVVKKTTQEEKFKFEPLFRPKGPKWEHLE
jgi:hypothetical protein